jgi:hypothetical protein
MPSEGQFPIRSQLGLQVLEAALFTAEKRQLRLPRAVLTAQLLQCAQKVYELGYCSDCCFS